MEEDLKCLFGTQFRSVLVDEDNEDRPLSNSVTADPRTGFFLVRELRDKNTGEKDGRLALERFIPLTPSDYHLLKSQGVFD